MLNVLTFALGVFGAVGGVLWFSTKVRAGADAIGRLLAHRDVPRDFYLRKIDLAARWLAKGEELQTMRRGIIVSRSESLKSMPLSVGPASLIKFEVTSAPPAVRGAGTGRGREGR